MHHPLLAAAVTPLRDNGAALDVDAIAPLVAHLEQGGVDGVFCCGTTGEGVLLSYEERIRAAAAYRSACGGSLIVHCGAQTTAETAALAAHAASIGADGAAVIAPPYYPLDDGDLVEHFVAAAHACDPLPYYLYAFTARSGLTGSDELGRLGRAFDAMALGTAGYTAALAVERMEQVGLKPANGSVIVTGATGGVGSVAVDILAGAGYHVVALTGKEAETDYLKSLGAKEVMLRASLDLSKIKPLDKATWAGAVDNLGGDVLAWLAATMQIGGALASIGLAASHTLNTTVMPFILRGVSLVGVDSVNTPMPLRQKVWKRLAQDLKPKHLAAMTSTVQLQELPGVFDKILKAQMRGRTVVAVGG